MQPSVNQSLFKGVERSVGVIVGVLIAYAAGTAFGHDAWVVLAVIVVSLMLSWLLRLSPGSSNQIPISAMLVLAIGAQTHDYALNRILETVIGAVIGLIVNAAIVPPVLAGPAHDAVTKLADEVAGTLRAVAGALREPQDRVSLDGLLTRARGLRTVRESAISALEKADDSLTLNPRGRRHRQLLARDRDFLPVVTVFVNTIPGMVRGLHDRYDPSLTADPVVSSIAVELDRVAHDLLLLLPNAAAPADAHPITAELPALTAPLVVARPDPQNWIIVGALLEDLRRMRLEIVGGLD
ncbi:MAG: FUSC family protein [Actinomycetota bacterium]